MGHGVGMLQPTYKGHTEPVGSLQRRSYHTVGHPNGIASEQISLIEIGDDQSMGKWLPVALTHHRGWIGYAVAHLQRSH